MTPRRAYKKGEIDPVKMVFFRVGVEFAAMAVIGLICALIAMFVFGVEPDYTGV